MNQTAKEKIEFILAVMPNVEKIIKFATEKQINQLVQQAQEKLEHELDETSFA